MNVTLSLNKHSTIDFPEYVPIGATSVDAMFSSGRYLAHIKTEEMQTNENGLKSLGTDLKPESTTENAKIEKSAEKEQEKPVKVIKQKVDHSASSKKLSRLKESKKIEPLKAKKLRPIENRALPKTAQNKSTFPPKTASLLEDKVSNPYSKEMMESCSLQNNVQANAAKLEAEKYNIPLIHTYSFPNALATQKRQKVYSEAELVYSQKYTKESIASTIHFKVAGMPQQELRGAGFKGHKLTTSLMRRLCPAKAKNPSSLARASSSSNIRRSNAQFEGIQMSECVITGKQTVISREQAERFVMQNKIIKERSMLDNEALSKKDTESLEDNNHIFKDTLERIDTGFKDKQNIQNDPYQIQQTMLSDSKFSWFIDIFNRNQQQ